MAATIGRKVETAFAQLVANLAITGLEVYTGLDNDEKDAPAVIVSAGTAREECVGCGVWHVPLTIHVRQIAADTEEDAADAIAGQVFTACVEADVTALGNLASIKIFDLLTNENGQGESGDAWDAQTNLEVICALG
jgi:hypothetical protein